MPPKHEPPTPKLIKPRPEKWASIVRRGFTWEVIKQLFEDYWLDAHYQNDVLRPGEELARPNRMVLQFKQGDFFYRMAFELIKNEYGPFPVEAYMVTIFHDGNTPGLPCCPVQVLDGTYDLPTENIK